MGALLVAACGSDEDRPPPIGSTGGASGSGGVDAGSGGSLGAGASGGAAGSGGTPGSGGSTASGGSAGSAGRGGGLGSGGTSGGDAGNEPAPPECVRTCNAAADCAKAGASPPFDGNNWSCDAGKCRWLGCLADDECSFFGGVCRLHAVSSSDVKTCTESCDEASACVETLASVDLDNWTCTERGCVYTGCISDDECVRDFGAGARCMPGKTYKSCVRPCTAPADCVSQGALPHQDADNWECRDNSCVYAGCKSDRECTDAEGLPARCLAP